MSEYRRVDGKRRYTYVVEYASDEDIPLVHAGMQALGGDVVAVQFSDALRELEDYYDKED